MFSVQVVDYGKLIYPLDYTDPMISGVLYRKIIPKGQIAYYYGAKTDISSNKYDYSITRVKGLSKLYIDYCTNFPFCRYKDGDLANNNGDINYTYENKNKRNTSNNINRYLKPFNPILGETFEFFDNDYIILWFFH